MAAAMLVNFKHIKKNVISFRVNLLSMSGFRNAFKPGPCALTELNINIKKKIRSKLSTPIVKNVSFGSFKKIVWIVKARY